MDLSQLHGIELWFRPSIRTKCKNVLKQNFNRELKRQNQYFNNQNGVSDRAFEHVIILLISL